MGYTKRRGAKELVAGLLRVGHGLNWRRLERWLPVTIVVVTLGIWEWQVRAGGLSALFFPAPSTIALTFVRLLANGRLPANVGATLSRLLLGFALGGIPGMVLGLFMGWSRRLRVVIDPFIAAGHPIPKIAILPLFMVIFGIGELPKVILVAVVAFFPMLINTMTGVRQISPIHFDVARNYGASLIKVFTRVVVPGSLPLILTGARLALNVALLITIAVELVAAQKGLGRMIWFAWETLRVEELYASIAMAAILGISFNLFLQRMAMHLAPWQVEREI